MTIEALLADLTDNVPIGIMLLIIAWLSLPQLAERFEIVGKLARPLSKRWREKAERLEKQQQQAAYDIAKKLAAAAIKEMTPPDYAALNRRLTTLSQILADLQDDDAMLKSFITYDDLWHFADDRNEARRGRRPQHRMTFDEFEDKWKSGWRPFDDDGQFIDGGTPE